MTVEEAIKSIDDVLNSDYYYDESIGYQMTSDDFEWLEKSKKALEKQMPKKPTLRDKYYFYCPCCNEDLAIQEEDMSIYSMTPPKYCLHCGQALDWSDTE